LRIYHALKSAAECASINLRGLIGRLERRARRPNGPTRILDRHQDDAIPRKPRIVVEWLVSRPVDERTAMHPDHYWQPLSSDTRAGVKTLSVRHLRFAECGAIWSFPIVWGALYVITVHSRTSPPLCRWRGRFPSVVACLGSGIRNAAIYTHSPRRVPDNRAGDEAAGGTNRILNLHHLSLSFIVDAVRRRFAMAQSSGHQRRASQAH